MSGGEINSVDRRLSCTPLIPVAKNSREKSGTSPSKQFKKMRNKDSNSQKHQYPSAAETFTI